MHITRMSTACMCVQCLPSRAASNCPSLRRVHVHWVLLSLIGSLLGWRSSRGWARVLLHLLGTLWGGTAAAWLGLSYQPLPSSLQHQTSISMQLGWCGMCKKTCASKNCCLPGVKLPTSFPSSLQHTKPINTTTFHCGARTNTCASNDSSVLEAKHRH